MLRYDHKLTIKQNVDGKDHYTVLKLVDEVENSCTYVAGAWLPTADSYNGREIRFTSDNPKYLHWEWTGGPDRGNLSLGSKMGRASHKEGEDSIFQTLIFLSGVRRLADGRFQGAGSGRLFYSSKPDFQAGTVEWTVER